MCVSSLKLSLKFLPETSSEQRTFVSVYPTAIAIWEKKIGSSFLVGEMALPTVLVTHSTTGQLRVSVNACMQKRVNSVPLSVLHCPVMLHVGKLCGWLTSLVSEETCACLNLGSR